MRDECAERRRGSLAAAPRLMPRGVVLVALLLSVSACDQDRSVGDTASPRRSTGSERFLTYTQARQLDYDPAATPAELLALSDAVVLGTIVDVQPGQSYAPTPDAQPEIATSVLHVKVAQFLAGDPRVVSGGYVYVEIAHPAFVGTGSEDGMVVSFDQRAFAESVPMVETLLFLDDRTEEPYWETVVDKGAGRPAGTRITTPMEQGFLFEDSTGELVSAFVPIDQMPEAWRSLDSLDEVVGQLTTSA